MLYKEQRKEEIVLVRYYNVIFYLKFRREIDELKKDIIIAHIDSGGRINMKGLYGWCKNQDVPVEMRFFYRRDMSVRANIWNLYSYCRFRLETRIDEMRSGV